MPGNEHNRLFRKNQLRTLILEEKTPTMASGSHGDFRQRL